MMTDFQPPPIFAVQSLGKQQQHHSERKSVRFKHRNYGVWFAFAVSKRKSMCGLYVRKIEYIEDQATKERNFFISCPRARPVWYDIGSCCILLQHPSEYMHMRLGLLLALLLAVSCSTLPPFYPPYSRARYIFTVLSFHSHIHQEATHKYSRTEIINNSLSFALCLCGEILVRFSVTFFKLIQFVHLLVVVCARLFFLKAHALVVFILFTSCCVGCVFTSNIEAKWNVYIYYHDGNGVMLLLLVHPNSLSFIVARTFAIPTRSTLFQLCSMPARIFNVIETRFETFKWIWIIRYFTFRTLFLYIHIAQCDWFSLLPHFIQWLIISMRKFLCHSTLPDFWLDFLVLSVFLLCFIDIICDLMMANEWFFFFIFSN